MNGKTLTMRMSMRRFTRLTNGFSKKLENHIAAISLRYMFYNFCRIHKTPRCTPAMAAGVTSKLWEIDDIIRVLDNYLPKPEKRGSYKKEWYKIKIHDAPKFCVHPPKLSSRFYHRY
jgi:hypothetical protein